LSVGPAAASFEPNSTTGWLDLNQIAYSELSLEAYRSVGSIYRSERIKRSSLRIPFGASGYFLFNDENGYYWCGGDKSFTDDGIGQVNQPVGAPNDCFSHSALGSGFDFGSSLMANTQLTMCGNDGNNFMLAVGTSYGQQTVFPRSGLSGLAFAIWVR